MTNKAYPHHRPRHLRSILVATVALVVWLGVPALASAQAPRTWVSGVGDDANPCSRTAPCKTFAGAISKTAAGGIISVLDPGGYGAVTITKSITIDGGGELASVLVSGTNGITINDGGTSTITVQLRNLRIEASPSGIAGISVVSARRVHIENSVIWGFTNGIDFRPAVSPTRLTVQNTTIYGNTNDGINIAAGTGGTAATSNRATIENSTIEENSNNGIEVTALGSFKAAANTFNSLIADNGTGSSGGTTNNGVLANGGNATVRLGMNDISGNGMGIQSQNGGAVLSWGDNHIAGNNVDGAPTGMLGRL